MKIKTIMTREVATCYPEDPMYVPAHIMWDRDCGVVPVVDPYTGRLEGVVTDRDLCMAALLSDRPLSRMTVCQAMSRSAYSCSEDDDVRDVHAMMREHQIRRLPVLDENEHLVGLVTLNDLAVEAFAKRGAAATKRQRDVAKTYAAICQHRELVTTE